VGAERGIAACLAHLAKVREGPQQSLLHGVLCLVWIADDGPWLIRYFAVSNFTVDQVALYVAAEAHLSVRCRVLAVQNQWDMVQGESAACRGVLEYAAAAAWRSSPLARSPGACSQSGTWSRDAPAPEIGWSTKAPWPSWPHRRL